MCFFFQSRATECPLPLHLTIRSSLHAEMRPTLNFSQLAASQMTHLPVLNATAYPTRPPLNLHALQARCGPSVQTLFVPFLTLLECTHFYTVRVPRKVNKTRNSISRVTPRNQQNIH